MQIDIVKIVRLLACAFIALLLSWVLRGCKTPQPIVVENTREVVRETHRTDTLIAFVPDTASLQALLLCDSAGHVLIARLTEEQGKRLALETRLRQTAQGTELRVDCKADSLQAVVNKLREQIIMGETTHDTQVQEIVPTFYRNCTRGFFVLLSVIVLYIVVRILIRVYLKK